MNNSFDDKAVFSAEMSAEEFEIGERSHQEIEKHRRLVMAIGLTKDSSSIRESLSKDLDSYLHAIDLAEDTIDHYNDVIELLALSANKLKVVLEEQLQEFSESLTEDQKVRVSEILGGESPNTNH